MNNKLVLDRGTQQYIWDKHEIDKLYTYHWEQRFVVEDYIYKWNQCKAVYSTQYYWDMYQKINNMMFQWDKYGLVENPSYIWNSYNVKDTYTHYWSKYNRGITYYWDVYQDAILNYKWNKCKVGSNYHYRYKYALSDYNKYLVYMDITSLTFRNIINPDGYNFAIYSHSDFEDVLPDGMMPPFIFELTDLDLATVDGISIDFSTRLNAYSTDTEAISIYDIPYKSWRYELDVPSTYDKTFTVETINDVLPFITSDPSYDVIFTKTNGEYDKTTYYIATLGLTKVEGTKIKNILKVKFDFDPNIYYNTRFNTTRRTLPGSACKTTRSIGNDGYFYWNCTKVINESGGCITDLVMAPYESVYDKYLEETTTTQKPIGLVTDDYDKAHGYLTYGYIRELVEVIEGPSTVIEVVNSNNLNAYPENGKQGDYWYSLLLDSTSFVSGTLITAVNSTEANAYPQLGIHTDGYTYVFREQEYNGLKGDYVGIVSSSSSSTYPMDGYYGSYWYVYDRQEVIKSAGTLIGKVSSSDYNAYPQNGIQDNIWYIYSSNDSTYTKGEYIESVEDSDGAAYPESGKQGDYWYEATGSYSIPTKGSYVGQITSTINNEYPIDGPLGDYWYVYNYESAGYSKGEPTGIVVSSEEENAYPINGRLESDGYWYESIEPEIIYKKGFIYYYRSSTDPNKYPEDGIQDGYWYVRYKVTSEDIRGDFIEKAYSTYRYQYPSDAKSGNYWYVYQGDGILPFTITDAGLYGGIKYKSYINTEADWRAGTVSSASIEFTTSFPTELGDEIQYFKRYSRDDSWSYVDNYIVDEVIKTPYQDVYKVVAYDYITLFDVYVDEWLKTLTYPITIQNLYTQLVEHIATISGKSFVTFKTDIGANGSIQVLHGFEGVNITGRQILQFIAEAAGRCVGMRSTEDARFIDVQVWGEAGTFDSVPSNRVSLNMSEYEIAAPTRVVVRATEDDVGGGAGSGTEGYDVVGNPLFYGVSQTTLDTAAAGILSEMTPAHNFHNGTLEMLQDYDIPINSWFRIYAADGTTDLGYFLAMGKEFDGKGVKYTCEGKATRDTQASNQNSEIIALLGKYNELKSSIDENSATIVDLTKGQSSITQRVDSISTSVSDLKGNQSSITQTVNSLNSKVTAQGNKVNSLESEINQTAEEISLKVSKNEIISAINLSSEKVDISSDKINLTGYVTATDLKTGGATTINGSNITTGTISADRINLTGAISWGDLDSFVQSEIEAGGGSVSLPSYIKTSYIGPTEIRSPTITGNDIQVYNTFQTINSSGNVTGYMGAARGKDGYGNTTYGVAMSNSWSSNTYDVGDNYIIATNAGIRMESDENSITATEASIHLTAKNGSIYINTPNGKAYYNGVELGGSSGAVIPVWG